jgi:hypothetical protein
VVSDAFAAVLRARRSEFNARFAEARRQNSGADPAAFGTFLETTADVVVQAVHRLRPDRVPEVAAVAYEVGLQLVSHRLAGPGARHDALDEAWRRILPAAASLVAEVPRTVLPAMSNAAHHLAAAPGARISGWIETLERLAPRCPDARTLLTLGQVAAWRAGLAHYRESALAVADTLPESLALAAVEAREGACWPAVRDRLRAEPWFDPSRPVESEPRSEALSVAATVGAFRGFGGLFTEPPRVRAVGEWLYVQSADEFWVLTADVFGATLHRVPVDAAASASLRLDLPPEVTVTRRGVEWRGRVLDTHAFGDPTSVALTSTTLAVTCAAAHRVILVPRPTLS